MFVFLLPVTMTLSMQQQLGRSDRKYHMLPTSTLIGIVADKEFYQFAVWRGMEVVEWLAWVMAVSPNSARGL